MKNHSKYIMTITIPLLVFVIASMSFGNAYAHKADVVGDYKIEIGWDKEPPIQGIENSIELVVTHATEEDKKNAEEMDAAMDMASDADMTHDEDHADMTHDEDHHDEEGIAGLENTLSVSVTLDGQTSTIDVMATSVDGIYQGKFTPSSSGYPIVHLSGMIHETDVDLDMHPEEVEALSTLPPLKQINSGIDPSDVQCKEGLELFMRTHDDSAICASNELGLRLMELGVVDYF